MDKLNYSPVYEGYTIASTDDVARKLKNVGKYSNRYNTVSLPNISKKVSSRFADSTKALSSLRNTITRSIELKGLNSIVSGIGKEYERFHKGRGSLPAGSELFGRTVHPAGIKEVAYGNSVVESASEIAELVVGKYIRQAQLLRQETESQKQAIQKLRDSQIRELNLRADLLDIQKEKTIDSLDIGFKREITGINRSLNSIRTNVAILKEQGRYLHKQYGFNQRQLNIDLATASILNKQMNNLYSPDSIHSGALLSARTGLSNAIFIGQQRIASKLNEPQAEGLQRGRLAIRLALVGDASIEASVIDAYSQRASALNQLNRVYKDAEVSATRSNQDTLNKIRQAQLNFDERKAKIDTDIESVQIRVKGQKREANLLYSLARAVRKSYRNQKRFAVLQHGIQKAINLENINQINIRSDRELDNLDFRLKRFNNQVLDEVDNYQASLIETEHQIKASFDQFHATPITTGLSLSQRVPSRTAINPTDLNVLNRDIFRASGRNQSQSLGRLDSAN